MRETAILLLCAVALAHGGDITASRDVRACNCDPSEAQKICEANFDSDNVLIAHEFCDKFYKCSNGRPYPYQCPSNLLYDPVKEECEWPDLVQCGDRPVSGSDNGESGGADCDGENDSGSDNNVTPPADNDNSSNDGGTCNCNPGEAPSICAAEDSDGILVAHENCNQFYKCAGGIPVAFVCFGDLLYNPHTEQCDYAKFVECGDRVIPKPDEDGGNDNGSDNDDGGNEIVGGGNCDPSEAPSICAADDSEGILVAHEYCDQYYICTGGKPVARPCPPNLLFDPTTDRCEWAKDVDCGERFIPEPCDDDNVDDDSDIDDNLANDNDDSNDDAQNDNTGTCNCKPEEAPGICASEDSSGILIAHENCNQFYICDHGKPVAMTCGPNTFYNPYTEKCDWASNVDCGDRLVPDPEDNGSNDNGGNDQGGSDNGGNDQGGSDNGGIDNGGNDNNGTCNCKPEEAPGICASEDSSGILIAHENCNQFYICDHGKPVAMTCGPNTFYNPYTEKCDWASNVDCGDRLIPDPEDNGSNDNGGNDQGGSDNGGNDQGGSDNGGIDNGGNDNNGTCNCKPEEAPGICASEDSSGILIAHENCNQFYICDHGKPVAMTCGPNTFYNPYTEKCDWASNVDCGDRLIPDPEDNGSNDNGGNDQGGSDNGGNDQGSSDNGGIDNGGNDNDGTCNCKPEEAPGICASEDSSGILIAHENCNQFYICDHGKPVAMTCGPNTFYNPYTEKCDWASNVDCGDRLIPDPEDNGSNDNGGNDQGGSDNGGNDQGGSDNGGIDNGGNDNNGTCNCKPEEAPGICASEDSSGILIAHENCNQFYICDHGKPVAMTCGPNTFYNPYTEKCDWASNVDCGDRLVPDPEDNGSNDNGGNDQGGSDNGGNDQGGSDNGGIDNGGNDNNGTCNCKPEEAPGICASEDSSGILIAHENCNQFYICDHGKPVAMTCGPNTFYNPYTEKCDWASNVDCGDRLIPDPEDNGSNDNGGNDQGGSDNGGNDQGGSDNGGIDNGGNDNNGTCNCKPEEAPGICASEDSSGILIAHENCNQFYICDHGKPVAMTCGPNTFYNPYTEKCDWASNVDCGDRLIPDPEDNGSNDNGGNDQGGSDNGGNDQGGSDNGGIDNGGNDNNGTCNCKPEEAPGICASEDSSGILIAHENCNQFYICDHGKPVAMTCGPNTFYNPYTEKCDWASNVDCGDRLIPDPEDNGSNDNGGNDQGGSDNGGNDQGSSDNGGIDNGGNDNDGTCNCKPEEAPGICASEDSSGILIAHENCNQFYICDHGKPVAMTCGPNTFYNPYTEKCDWASNVDCGDRLIPDPEDNGSNDNGGNDQGGSDNGGNDQGGSDNGGIDNGGNDNNGTCNCKPEEAPGICASEDSSGILIAHENCNQFYICDHGKPVAMTCGPNTFYNPYTEKCDWASNVDCGDRLVPDPEDNGSNDNGGNDQGGSDNGGNDQGGSDNGGIDNGGNDNNGTCNCKPEEAPGICASEDSSGILIAHENCNQFYICDHGKPVAMTCGPNTFYNPYTEKCDWASNVDCGDRLIPDPEDNGSNDNGGNDQGGSDNGGNDQGGSDNGGIDNGGNDNNGTCNCKPEEAPGICASEDSSGILIAHENCNQFYICDHGKPVAMTCGPNTFYNPYTEKCDWASNVDCGDRLIPDPEDNGSNDNGGNDQGGSDNGGNDQGGSDNGGIDNGGNDNNGTCNCKPEEAPGICASEDSSGILIAHENCNQFYICDHGKPVAMTCGPNTFYNPYTEKCDWASNVDCGDRLIPDPEDNGSNDNGGNDQGGSDNGGNDQGGSDNGGIDNGGNDNDGTCNCKPEEAPGICASEDSSGILIAHENCNQFYICDHGKPVALTCGPNTFYNPYTEKCDWASNVDCGDRLIPDPEDNGSNDNGGNDQGGSDNGGNDQGGSDNGGIDNGGNDNNGTCNCKPEEAPGICASEDSSGILIAHENCNQFYICDHGKPVAMTCGPNTFYNPYTEKCDWASNVDCGDRLIPDPENNGSNDNGGNDQGGSDNGGNDQGGSDNGGIDNGGNDNDGTCNCKPEEAPGICASEDSSGILIAHENCNQFYICDHGKPVAMTCGPNTFYNPYTEKCDWASNVDCGDRLIPDPEDNGSNDNGGNDQGGSDNGGNDQGGSDNGGIDNGGNDNNGTCNCKPEEAPGICASEDSSGILIAHENCNQFYICDHGKPVAMTCGPNTFYNPFTEKCDWASNVDCGDRLIPDPEDNGSNDNGGNDQGGSDNGGNDQGGSDNGGIDNGGNDNNGTCNCKPEEAPGICASEDSSGILIAHENCNQFYICDHGKPVAMTCGPNTFYNPYTEKCDWASEVDCGDRLIPDPDNDNDSGNDSDIDDNLGNDSEGDIDDNLGNDIENDNSCNCYPDQAPSICAEEDSNGVLIAHENCNQFYMCSNGAPVAMTCPPNTLYNPYKRECDWESEVECGDRLIPQPEDNDAGSDNNGSDNDGDDDDNNEPINDDPSQAPAICAESDSTGVLVAHENCNQFYQCSGGLPIAISCAGNLLFNPVTKQCDWPRNVDCGDRIIPGTDDDCACNPRNAPALCSRENFDGKFVAHENCNQFYVCVNRVPLPRYCAPSLFYSIEKEECDWPQNVDCSSRTIVLYSSLNKHMESRQPLREWIF